MTDSRPDKGPAARRARALAREETAEQRRLEKLGIHVWPPTGLRRANGTYPGAECANDDTAA